MEDADNYLAQRRLSGFHRTIMNPPQDPLFRNASRALINSHSQEVYANGNYHASTTNGSSGLNAADILSTHDKLPIKNLRVFVSHYLSGQALSARCVQCLSTYAKRRTIYLMKRYVGAILAIRLPTSARLFHGDSMSIVSPWGSYMTFSRTLSPNQ